MMSRIQIRRLPLKRRIESWLGRVVDSPARAGGYFYFYFTLCGAELHAGWGNG